jgi:hypothetical protein
MLLWIVLIAVSYITQFVVLSKSYPRCPGTVDHSRTTFVVAATVLLNNIAKVSEHQSPEKSSPITLSMPPTSPATLPTSALRS